MGEHLQFILLQILTSLWTDPTEEIQTLLMAEKSVPLTWYPFSALAKYFFGEYEISYKNGSNPRHLWQMGDLQISRGSKIVPKLGSESNATTTQELTIKLMIIVSDSFLSLKTR